MKRKASLLLLFFTLWSCQTEDEKPSTEPKEIAVEAPEQGEPSEVKDPLTKLHEITSVFENEAPPTEILLTKKDVELVLLFFSTGSPEDQTAWKHALVQGVGVDNTDIDQILLNSVRSGMRDENTPLLLQIIEARRQLSKK